MQNKDNYSPITIKDSSLDSTVHIQLILIAHYRLYYILGLLLGQSMGPVLLCTKPKRMLTCVSTTVRHNYPYF